MSPWLVTLAVLVGCGRLSFDGTPDATPPADAFVCTNPVGHDEDGDSVDDACDVCPQLADDQADDDADGVGDACDVSTARQQRTFFDPFTGMRSEWMYNAAVTFGTDSITMPGTNNSLGIQLLGTPGRTILEVGGRVAGGGNGSRQVAIHISEAVGVANYYCELYDGNSSLFLMITYTLDEVNFNNLDAVEIGGRLDAASFRMTFVHASPDLSCVAYYNGTRYEVAATDPGNISPDAMYFAINNIDVELDYFDRLATP